MKINKNLKTIIVILLAGSIGIVGVSGQSAFEAPDGGWDYLYEGSDALFADDFGALDGKWSHGNGSDQWDGSEIGGDIGPGNAPGGAMSLEENGVSYLRLQDPGDPRDHGFSDPTNRKVYFGYDLSAAGASETIMDDGVTLYFRARIPTDGPIDPLHRDGQPEPTPYPENGDGYVTSDGGKGNFVIKQASGGAIAFSLTTATDTSGGDPNGAATGFSGLSMNEFNGNQISGDVNFGSGQGENVLPLDPTKWHEFWITMQRDEGEVGTHTAFIYIDGNDKPTTFTITAGTGDDYSGISYLAMGATATPQNAALDIDFFGYKLSAVFPPRKSFKDPDGGWDYSYQGAEAIYADDFGSLDGFWSHNNGSDQWDGSGLGGEFGPGNAPGGAMIINESGIDFLRIQDPGDPRDHGFSDPTNRKVYLGYDLSAAGASDTIMDDGVTFHFRARIPTDGPIDALHRDGQPEPTPYPEEGDGYVTSDGGKGNFVIKQASGGAIAFSLTTKTDTSGGDPNGAATGFAGLSMNEFNGNQISGNVNFGSGQGENVVPLDPTQWHEFWIVIQRDEGEVGTHTAVIYVDGNTTQPNSFKITAGTGDDYSGISYLAMGSTATPQNSALDVDFFEYKLAAVQPEGASLVPPANIGALSPGRGETAIDPAFGIQFVASSIGAIPREGIHVELNGQDFTTDLQISGNEQRWEVSLTTLAPNTIYEGELSITDAEGTTVTSVLDFDTFGADSNFLVEAEDFNFNSGEFFDEYLISYDVLFPPINYLDVVGVEGIDSHEIDGLGDHFYRIPDPVATAANSDFSRPQYEGFEDLDTSVSDVLDGEWLNYTRTLPAGDYAIVARFSSIPPDTDFNFAVNGDPFVAQVDRVTSGATTANQTLEKIGVFAGSTIVRQDAQTYEYFFMTDDDDNIATFSADGVTTVRITNNSGGYLANYYVIIPAEDLPQPSGPVLPATLSINSSGDDITIAWDEPGTLESALSVLGPWAAVDGASSPYSASASEASTYYRVVAD